MLFVCAFLKVTFQERRRQRCSQLHCVYPWGPESNARLFGKIFLRSLRSALFTLMRFCKVFHFSEFTWRSVEGWVRIGSKVGCITLIVWMSYSLTFVWRSHRASSPLSQVYCQSVCPETPHSDRCWTKSSAQCSAGESVYIHYKGLVSLLHIWRSVYVLEYQFMSSDQTRQIYDYRVQASPIQNNPLWSIFGSSSAKALNYRKISIYCNIYD